MSHPYLSMLQKYNQMALHKTQWKLVAQNVIIQRFSSDFKCVYTMFKKALAISMPTEYKTLWK